MSNYPALGALIGTAFAFAWAVAGSVHLVSFPRRVLALGGSILISVSLAVALIRQFRRAPSSPGAAGHFDGGLYSLAVAFEACAILLAVLACRRFSRSDLILPAVAGIAGLHFFGLAAALGDAGTVFLWTGGATTALAALAMWRVRPPESRFWAAVTGLGCAGILWLSALTALR